MEQASPWEREKERNTAKRSGRLKNREARKKSTTQKQTTGEEDFIVVRPKLVYVHTGAPGGALHYHRTGLQLSHNSSHHS